MHLYMQIRLSGNITINIQYMCVILHKFGLIVQEMHIMHTRWLYKKLEENIAGESMNVLKKIYIQSIY